MTKRFIFFAFIIVLITACNKARSVESFMPTETPILSILTGTPLPLFPTFTPTPSLPLPELSEFPSRAELNEALPRENLILARHLYGDPVGHMQGDEFCYDVGIYDDDTYIVISCLPDLAYPAPYGRLDENQSKYLLRWMEKFQSFDEPSIHGLLTFKGLGETVPDFADKVSMQAMIGEIEWAAHKYVHRGGIPPAIFHAREVLSHRLNKWLDDSSMLNFKAVDFPDSCLGAPKPDEVCEQVPEQGFRIQFVVDGLLYGYHTDPFGYNIRLFGGPRIAPTQGSPG